MRYSLLFTFLIASCGESAEPADKAVQPSKQDVFETGKVLGQDAAKAALKETLLFGALRRLANPLGR